MEMILLEQQAGSHTQDELGRSGRRGEGNQKLSKPSISSCSSYPSIVVAQELKARNSDLASLRAGRWQTLVLSSDISDAIALLFSSSTMLLLGITNERKEEDWWKRRIEGVGRK